MLDLSAPYIDSRDIIDELEALDDELDDSRTLPPEDMEYLELLRAIDREGRDLFPDWEYGETLIRSGATFVEYAVQLAGDIGAIDRDASWPLYCIDWERAAHDLQMDYSPIDIDGAEYWGRA